MPGNYKASLTVNGNPVELTGFPLEFVTKTLAGAISSLKETDEIRDLDLTMGFGKVKLFLNGRQVSLKPFPTLIFASTLSGMVAPLKGVEGKVNSLEIKMQAV